MEKILGKWSPAYRETATQTERLWIGTTAAQAAVDAARRERVWRVSRERVRPACLALVSALALVLVSALVVSAVSSREAECREPTEQWSELVANEQGKLCMVAERAGERQ